MENTIFPCTPTRNMNKTLDGGGRASKGKLFLVLFVHFPKETPYTMNFKMEGARAYEGGGGRTPGPAATRAHHEGVRKLNNTLKFHFCS